MTLTKHGVQQLVSVGLLCLVGARAHAELSKVADVEGITEYRLDNGLQVLLFPDSTRPTITVNITYLVGSRHEGYGEAGMAHLLEHMLFKGTPSHEQIPKALGDRGARFNGSTWVDRTNYYETLPANEDNLDFALRLEADRMINSYVRRADLVSEMTVVRNEFERGENSPFTVLRQRMYSSAYDWHNYGKSTIGNRSDIERVPIDKLQDFYRRYYQPDNAVLVIAGQFDESKALELVHKYFGSIPKPDRKLDRTYTTEPPKDGERKVVLRRVGEVGLVAVSYHIPAGPHPEFAAMRILANILATEPAGRLYQTLVVTKKASSIYASASSWYDPGLLMAVAEVRRDGSLREVEKTLVQEVEKIAEEGVTEDEVQRAQQQILKQREMALADTSRIAVQLSEWAAQGDWRLYFLFRDRIEQVTPEAVQQAAQLYLTRNNRTVGVFVPTDEPQRVSVPPRGDVAEMVRDYQGREQVAAGEDFDFSPANIDQRTKQGQLSSGIDYALLPKRSRGENVNLSLLLRYGSAEDMKGLTIAGDVLPELMTRGTKALSRQQLRDLLDKHRATLSTRGSRIGTIIVRIQTKRPELPAVLDILRQVLREASLPEEEFEIIRREQLAYLEQSRPQPDARVANIIGRALSPYEQGDIRYEPTLEEQIERMKQAKLDNVRRLYDEFVGGQHGQLALVGDFETAEILPLLEQIFDGWTAKMPQAHIDRLAATDRDGERESIETPDMENASYMSGLALAMNDEHPDYPALVIANHILGSSGLSSRLGDRVRQQEGLSYGIRSYLSARVVDMNASFRIYAITNPTNVEKLSAIIDEEVKKLVSDGVTQEELTRALTAKLEQRQMERTDDGQLAFTLTGNLYANRTMTYDAGMDEKIRQLTVKQVNQAIQKYLDLERQFVAVAGDFESTETGAEKPGQP